MNAIKEQNVVNPAGQIGGEPAPPGQEFTYTVRAQGRLIEAEEFGDIIVRANPDGSLVRLRDVARIELGAQNYKQLGRYRASRPAIIAVYQIARLERARRPAAPLKAQMEELADALPRRTWTTRSRSTPRCRSPRASPRSCTRSSRRWCS